MRAPLANFGVLLSVIVAGGASRALAVKCSEFTSREVCKSAANKSTCSWSKGKEKCKGKRKACGSLASKKKCRKSKYHNRCQWSFANEACRKVKCEEIDAKKDCKSKRVAGKKGCEWKDGVCAVGSDSEDAGAGAVVGATTTTSAFAGGSGDGPSDSDSDPDSDSDSGVVDCDELARGDTGGDTVSGWENGGIGDIIPHSGCTKTTTQAPENGDRNVHVGFPGRRLADARAAAQPRLW